MKSANAPFDVKTAARGGPVRWLVVGGLLLIAAIAVGTTIMAGTFRDRALERRRAPAREHRTADGPPFRPAARRFHGDPARGCRSDRELADSSSAGVQSAGCRVPNGMKCCGSGCAPSPMSRASTSSTPTGVLINSSERWPAPDVKIADRAFFKAFKSGSPFERFRIELVRGRFQAWLGDRRRLQGHGPERRVSGRRDARSHARAISRDSSPPSRLRRAPSIAMHHRDGTLLARYPPCRRRDRAKISRRAPHDQQKIFELNAIQHAFRQPGRRRGPADLLARADRFPDRDRRDHDRHRGAGRLAGSRCAS